MKTTLELPDLLIKQVKLRALRDGRKLKDMVAELLRKGLAAETPRRPGASPIILKDPETGLPVIQGTRTPTEDEEMTPERIAEILLMQEAAWHHAAGR